ncbi:MAG: protein kinase [Candidatus Korobacteraceae bacterium]
MKQKILVRVRFGPFELDVKAGELHCQGKTVLLQEQSFRLLRALIEQDGDLVSREDLQKQLWPNDTVVEFDHGINAAIKRLRRVLGDSPEEPKYIETVARRGYRLMVPVQWASPASDSEARNGGDRAGEILYVEQAGWIGQQVSHYRVLGMVGGGGMGVIYKAEDLLLHRAVALKFLPEEFSTDSKALLGLEREACLASSLNHLNICSIHELGKHEGQPFIAMELLAGQTLRDSFALDSPGAAGSAAPVPIGKLLDIAIQVCDGLRAAHEKGIIHRDIKPANIFLTSDGVVKILDFGLAKLVQGDVSEGQEDRPEVTSPADPSALAVLKLSRTGIAIGTAAYMSPEHVRGERLDARTDLFSLGVVLYQMATGTPPFRGETPALLFDAVLHNTPVAPARLNPSLPGKLEQIISRALEKDRNLRYQSASEMVADLRQVKGEITSAQLVVAAKEGADQAATSSRRTLRWKMVAVALLFMAFLGGGVYWRWHKFKPPALTDKDMIVLADFDNKTGDPVFDETLKQGLTIQLEQSPFLDLVSQGKVSRTLKLMGRSADDPITPSVAREICQRTGSKAMLSGSITSLGSQYVIGLEAVNCSTGDILAEAQQQAAGKEGVLKALDAAAISLRSKLGESLASVQKYATPLAEATTPSLEALQAYSQGKKTIITKGDMAALPLLKRAVELDPSFAVAYAAMAVSYNNLDEIGLAAEYARQAYALRLKVSERERLVIESSYYMFATGELEKAAQVYELWQGYYPRDGAPYANLVVTYAALGNWNKALEEALAAMRLEPNAASNYPNLGMIYTSLNRLDEAEAVYKQAEQHKVPRGFLFNDRYLLAFLKGDATQMADMAAAAMDKPGKEDLLLATQADTAGWSGRLRNARELTRRAMDSAQRNDAKETAASYQAAAALREVESGNRTQAKADADEALKLAPNRDVRAIAALALARSGDTVRAEKMAADLDRSFPLDTIVQKYWLPTIRAAAALERKDPNRAVELLSAASTIELGQPAQANVSLCPVYVRGEAYLMLHDGTAAAAEFGKFIDHRGIVLNFPWGALARLGLARAYVLSGDTTKAKTTYQDFLALWKDADPDISLYQQARAEYARIP